MITRKIDKGEADHALSPLYQAQNAAHKHEIL